MKIMQKFEKNNPILFEKILKYYDEMIISFDLCQECLTGLRFSVSYDEYTKMINTGGLTQLTNPK